MKKHASIAIALIIGITLGISSSLMSTNTPQLTGNQDRIWQEQIWNTSYLRQNSDLIVKGTVTEIHEARWTTEDGKRPEEITEHEIFHTADIKVGNTLMGDTKEELTLRIRGGTVGNMSMNAEDAPTLIEGDQAIFFIEKENSHYELFGAAHGVFYLSGDKAVRRKAPAKYRSVDLNQLKDSIHRRD